MARARKFECYVEFWTLPEHVEAIDALAANGLLSKSDLFRMALDNLLRQQGALAPRRLETNGQQHAVRS
jgi:hypothetical protein